ncbi:MAG: YihY/virulence factor BrkB family protein [Deltaproteobacteria bacterium]|nr:YihY/virulence factor BrkB family protein [Deltaproteobacteria bacterium]
MVKIWHRCKEFFSGALWQDEGWSPAVWPLVKGLRLLILGGWGLGRSHSLIQASSLAYSTILALIPLLALLFAILKGLGIQRLLAAQLLERLAPGSQEFAAQIFQYIEETKVTSLGVFGVVFLLAALVVVMTNVERAFNATWRVPQTRSLRRKLSDYLSIFLFFPILMAVAVSVTSNFLGHPEIRRLLAGILPEAIFAATGGLVSLAILWVAFIFIYLVMPNTPVRFTSALVGGIAGGTVWQAAQAIFIWFQGAATYYNVIYGALYHLLFLVIWIFWSWLIVLFGNEIAYAHQHLDYLSQEFRRGPLPPEPVDEYLGLVALLGISRRFVRRQPPLSLKELEQLLPWGDNLAGRVAQLLKDCNLVLEAAPTHDGGSPQFLPSLPLDQITVAEVLKCLRQARGEVLTRTLEGEPRMAELLQNLGESPAPPGWQSLSMQEMVNLISEEKNSEE